MPPLKQPKELYDNIEVNRSQKFLILFKYTSVKESYFTHMYCSNISCSSSCCSYSSICFPLEYGPMSKHTSLPDGTVS